MFISRVIIIVIFTCCFSNSVYSGITNYGNYPGADKIHVNDSKDQVLQALGKPSLISAKNDKTWYYIKVEIDRNIFRTTQKSRVLVIKFNDKHQASKISTIHNNKKSLTKLQPLQINTTSITYNKSIITQIIDSIKNLRPTI